MYQEVTIEIICPNCQKMAFFYTDWAREGYKRQPNKIGMVKCPNCGFNKTQEISGKDYFYQLEIGDRRLIARTLDNLLNIRAYFKNNKNNTEPELDFPKLFYKKKHLIIKRIDKIEALAKKLRGK